MPAFDYDSLLEEASTLVSQESAGLKLKIYFQKKGTILKDTQKPWLGSLTPGKKVKVDAIFVDVKFKDIDGINVLRGDKVVIVSAKFFNSDIEKFEKVIVGTEQWQIIDYEEVNTTGIDPLIYKVQVRK